MDPRINTFKFGFGYTSNVMERFTADLKAEELNYSAGNTNSIFWMVAHLAGIRLRICRRLGAEIELPPWESAVERGSPKNSPDFQAVASDPQQQQAILKLHLSLTGELLARFEELTPETLAADAGRTMPDGSSDLAGVINYLMQHEFYHLGQISVLRVQQGKPAIP